VDDCRRSIFLVTPVSRFASLDEELFPGRQWIRDRDNGKVLVAQASACLLLIFLAVGGLKNTG
jgi:hypothetical protein